MRIVSFTFFILLHSFSIYGRNVTITNYSGDEETGLMPQYEPPGIWNQQTFQPKPGDINPFNLSDSSVVTVTSTRVGNNAEDIWWMSLLFKGNTYPTLCVLCPILTGLFGLLKLGTAIYVVFVLNDGTSNLDFTLDGKHVDTYTNFVTPGFEAFNTTVYSNVDLPLASNGADGSHNLTISTANAVSFDFAIYTTSDSESSANTTSGVPSSTESVLPTSNTATSTTATSAPPSSSSSMTPSSASDTSMDTSHKSVATGTIVGATVGGILGFCVLLFVVLVLRRRCLKHPGKHKVEPFNLRSHIVSLPSSASPMREHTLDATPSSVRTGPFQEQSSAKEMSDAAYSDIPADEKRLIWQLQEKLREMQSHLDSLRNSQAAEAQRGISSLVEEVAALREHIAHLEEQQLSLSNEIFPPPSY